jgi:hypothetical protein
MADPLDDKRRQQTVDLARLGWSRRRIEETISIRQETAVRGTRASDEDTWPRLEVRRPSRSGH